MMRNLIDLVENETWRPVKTWLNASTGETMDMNFFHHHSDIVDENREEMGLPSDGHANTVAVAAGWVRISSGRELSHEAHGYVTGRDIRSTRKGVQWLIDKHVIPEWVDVEIYVGDRCVEFFVLGGAEIDRFARRGVRPAKIALAGAAEEPGEIVGRIRDRWITDTGRSAHDINRGECFSFADSVASAAPAMFQTIELGNLFTYDETGDPTGFDTKLLAKHWPNLKPFSGLTWAQMFDSNVGGLFWPGTHGWVHCATTGLSYDIEDVEGVRNPFDLSFFDGYKAQATARLQLK